MFVVHVSMFDNLIYFYVIRHETKTRNILWKDPQEPLPSKKSCLVYKHYSNLVCWVIDLCQCCIGFVLKPSHVIHVY